MTAHDPRIAATEVVIDGRPRLLIVDDEARTARLLGRMLREEGFDTEVAVDGAIAIERLARTPVFDLLITDFHVSGTDGLVIAARARLARAGIPVFVVTGDPRAVARETPALAEPVEVITKPVDFQVLVRHLHAAFADYRLATPTATLAGRNSLAPNR